VVDSCGFRTSSFPEAAAVLEADHICIPPGSRSELDFRLFRARNVEGQALSLSGRGISGHIPADADR
jgi:hypothetical protein